MRFFSVLCLVVGLGFASVSSACEEAEKPADYTSLVKQLRIHGVEPSRVPWAKVEAACVALIKDEVEYNHCRYDKALDSEYYTTDSKLCRNRARADWPEALTQRQPQLSVAQNGQTVTSLSQPSLTTQDLTAKRNATFEDCMSARGWRDTYNFVLGRDKN